MVTLLTCPEDRRPLHLFTNAEGVTGVVCLECGRIGADMDPSTRAGLAGGILTAEELNVLRHQARHMEIDG